MAALLFKLIRRLTRTESLNTAQEWSLFRSLNLKQSLKEPSSSFLFLLLLLRLQMAQQKVVVKILSMDDERTKQKAIEAVAEIYGIDSIAADLKEQKMTIIGEMDTVAIAKKLKKLGKVDIISVGPAKEEKKDDKKDEKKDDKK